MPTPLDETLPHSRVSRYPLDLRYVDLSGRWRHITVGQLGSAFRVPGEPGRLLVPDYSTQYDDPFYQHPTTAVICDVIDAATQQPEPLAPRAVARRAAQLAENEGLIDLLFAPRIDFFIFDQVACEQSSNTARYHIDSREGAWRRGRVEPDNLGTQVTPGQGLALLPPFDSLHNLRAEIATALNACGVSVTSHQRGPATGGHATVDLPPMPLVTMADQVLTAKYVIRNVAARHGKVACFLPRPLFGDAGCGIVLPIWIGSPEQRSAAAAGILQHAASLLVWCTPTTNSFKRLHADAQTPSLRAWSTCIPAASVHLPLPCAHTLHVRALDATCNPYLAGAAITLALLDGLADRLELGPPLERLPTDAAQPLPRSLDAALAAFDQDHDYLRIGDVFPDAIAEAWCTERRTEAEAIALRPHPYEFCLYFDL